MLGWDDEGVQPLLTKPSGGAFWDGEYQTPEAYQKATDAYNAQQAALEAALPKVKTKEELMATVKPEMTREQFIAKYALGPGGTFLADDKGGNAASEVAGRNVGEYYDMYLGPNAQITQKVGLDGDEVPLTWGSGRMPDGSIKQLDAWSFVDPHPESTSKSGWDTFLEIARPVAALAALYFTGGAAAGALAGEAGAVAGAGALAGEAGAVAGASGLAGTLGMDAGWAATAVNTGALNAGMTLARGGNIGDAARSGIIGAVLSPVGPIASNATTSALADSGLGAGWTKALGTVAGNAAIGGAGSLVSGKGLSGVAPGIINGIVNAAGNYVGDEIGSATGNKNIGSVASGATRAALTGKDVLGTIASEGVIAAINEIADAIPGFKELSEENKAVIRSSIDAAIRGKNVTPALINNIISGATAQVKKVKQHSGWS